MASDRTFFSKPHFRHEALINHFQHRFNPPAGAFLDGDVEGLIEKLQKSSITDDFMVGSHRNIPRGFPTNHAIEERDMRNAVEALQAYDEHVVAAANDQDLIDYSKAEYGFDPQELLQKHAIHPSQGKSDARSTLKNEILPLFAYERFFECAPEVYEALKPALRLASQLLTHPAVTNYWQTRLFACRENDPEASQAQSKPVQRIRYPLPSVPKGNEAVHKQWQQIEKHIRIGFDMNADVQSRLLGCMVIFPEQSLRRKLPDDAKDRPLHHSQIDLNFEFYTTALRLSMLKDNADLSMALRFYLMVANVLCHEIAHVVEQNYVAPRGQSECAMYNNKFVEAGWAWEHQVWGYNLQPVNNRMDCALGLFVQDRNYDPATGVLCQYRSVNMDWIVMLQQQETWEKDYSQAGLDAFHVPMTESATALALPYLLMGESGFEEDDVMMDAPESKSNELLRRTKEGRVSKTKAFKPLSSKTKPKLRMWRRLQSGLKAKPKPKAGAGAKANGMDKAGKPSKGKKTKGHTKGNSGAKVGQAGRHDSKTSSRFRR